MDEKTIKAIKSCRREIIRAENNKLAWTIFIIILGFVCLINSLSYTRSTLDFLSVFFLIPLVTAGIVVVARVLCNSEQNRQARLLCLIKREAGIVKDSGHEVSKEEIVLQRECVLLQNLGYNEDQIRVLLAMKLNKKSKSAISDENHSQSKESTEEVYQIDDCSEEEL